MFQDGIRLPLQPLLVPFTQSRRAARVQIRIPEFPDNVDGHYIIYSVILRVLRSIPCTGRCYSPGVDLQLFLAQLATQLAASQTTNYKKQCPWNPLRLLES
ncbi:Hypothetical predicted protein [Cloeon dipterum]|uniref:Uncharacterized protein n=1 Tax=Cloeon dipterum TaxID=197152 RepID=A0A8S1BYX7_9INSE|nr:Hypothetical predicted protein [Cloeon dipterum]